MPIRKKNQELIVIIYGLKQTLRIWYDRFASTFYHNGFHLSDMSKLKTKFEIPQVSAYVDGFTH